MVQQCGCRTSLKVTSEPGGGCGASAMESTGRTNCIVSLAEITGVVICILALDSFPPNRYFASDLKAAVRSSPFEASAILTSATTNGRYLRRLYFFLFLHNQQADSHNGSPVDTSPQQHRICVLQESSNIPSSGMWRTAAECIPVWGYLEYAES